MPLDDGLRGYVQVPRAAVESEALPDGKDVIERRRREIPYGGESFEKPLVIRCAACDPGPLKQVFGDQDPIGVPAAPPWEVSAIRAVPGEQARANIIPGGIAHRPHDASGDTS